MSKKKRANDLLTSALEDAPLARDSSGVPDVTAKQSARSHPVREVLEALQAQTLDAMTSPFFDGGSTTGMTPITKRLHSETGGVHVNAKRCEPAVEATVTIDVRCDQDEVGEAGRYQFRAVGHLKRECYGGEVDSEFLVPVKVGLEDGALTLDSDEMRNRIADAIRSTGHASGG